MSLPPPPTREKDLTGPAWQKWFSLVQEIVSPVAAGGLQLWSSISKSGSNLTHIETRSHSDLQNLNSEIAAHPTQEQLNELTGGASTNFHKHNHSLLDNLDTPNYSHITSVQKSLIPSGVPSVGHVPVATSDTTSIWRSLTAAEVTNTPAGSIAAATVQAAINELDVEKEPIFTAGGGLVKTGATLDVVGTANRIVVAADTVDIGTDVVTLLGTQTLSNKALVAPALGTPASGVATNLTGTAAGLTAGIALALKSATTTIDVSAATAPTAGQVLTASSGTAAAWATTASGGSSVSNVISGAITIAVDTTYTVAGYLKLDGDLRVDGNLIITG